MYDLGMEKKAIRFDLEGPIVDRWEKLLHDRKIGQLDAIKGLIEFVLGRSPLEQLVVLGQLEPTPEVLRAIYERIGVDRVKFAEGQAPATNVDARREIPQQDTPAHDRRRGQSKS